MVRLKLADGRERTKGKEGYEGFLGELYSGPRIAPKCIFGGLLHSKSE